MAPSNYRVRPLTLRQSTSEIAYHDVMRSAVVSASVGIASQIAYFALTSDILAQAILDANLMTLGIWGVLDLALSCALAFIALCISQKVIRARRLRDRRPNDRHRTRERKSKPVRGRRTYD